jgi:hypothetical protein
MLTLELEEEKDQQGVAYTYMYPMYLVCRDFEQAILSLI